MVCFSKAVQLAMLGLAGLALAHETHEGVGMTDLGKRNFYAHNRRNLDKCSEHLQRRGISARAEARRKATAEKERKKRELIDAPYLRVRDTATILDTSHHSNLTGVTVNSPDSVFYSDNVTCVLAPEQTIGPYWVKGELVRTNITNGQEGVDLTLDIQLIDTTTCEPLEGIFWDLWHCNSTGVYAGVIANGNGNEDDETNLDNTAFRGIQITDSDGVAQVVTKFPGHYSGRATHIHAVAHVNSSLLGNDTLDGGSVSHIGQIYFDQDLIYQVEALAPYNTNSINITTNADDFILTGATENSTSDPMVEYVLLGDSVADGLFGWVTIGVDTQASYNASYAALYTADGGEDVSGTDPA